jgi:peptide-methionine (S)-S-oxide reductase
MANKTLLAIITAVGLAATCALQAAEPAFRAPAPAYDLPKQPGEPQTAVLAGGCFWGVEGVYEHVRGVIGVESGYSGGMKQTAQYDVVSGGSTGHAESVRIVYDPSRITYGEILRIFFSVVHDPTQLNRQGPDHGTQYRSAIFYADDAQRDVATRYIAQLDAAKVYPGPIVTRVDPLKGFYPAERYHQDFIDKNPRYPYIVYNDLPKIRNLKVVFPDVYLDSSLASTAVATAQ